MFLRTSVCSVLAAKLSPWVVIACTLERHALLFSCCCKGGLVKKGGGCLAGASLGAHQQKHTKGPFFNSGHRSAWVSRDTKLHVGVSQKPGTTLTTLFFVQVNLGPLRGEWWFLWGYRSTWFGSSRTDCQACGWPQGSTGRDGLSRFRGGTAVLYYWVMDGDGTEPLSACRAWSDPI